MKDATKIELPDRFITERAGSVHAQDRRLAAAKVLADLSWYATTSPVAPLTSAVRSLPALPPDRIESRRRFGTGDLALRSRQLSVIAAFPAARTHLARSVLARRWRRDYFAARHNGCSE